MPQTATAAGAEPGRRMELGTSCGVSLQVAGVQAPGLHLLSASERGAEAGSEALQPGLEPAL